MSKQSKEEIPAEDIYVRQCEMAYIIGQLSALVIYMERDGRLTEKEAELVKQVIKKEEKLFGYQT